MDVVDSASAGQFTQDDSLVVLDGLMVLAQHAVSTTPVEVTDRIDWPLLLGQDFLEPVSTGCWGLMASCRQDTLCTGLCWDTQT